MCLVYIYDVIVFSKTEEKHFDHLEHVKEVNPHRTFLDSKRKFHIDEGPVCLMYLADVLPTNVRNYGYSNPISGLFFAPH